MTVQDFEQQGIKGVQENVPLYTCTTFQIGGPARFFLKASSVQEIISVVNVAKKNQFPYRVLGGGSNVWISDQGFPGLLIKNEARQITFTGTSALVDAGVTWGALTVFAHQKGLVGLESLTHIPGTIGGGIWGNAGSFGKETADVVRRVRVLRSEGVSEWITQDACGFSYRQSMFKKHPEWVILQAEIMLLSGDVQASQAMIREHLEYRASTQPLTMPCAGCMFKNPDPEHGLYASKLIDDAGLKGKQYGHARVSPKHANFIENLGGATSRDVERLVADIKETILKKYTISLEEEVIRIGF